MQISREKFYCKNGIFDQISLSPGTKWLSRQINRKPTSKTYLPLVGFRLEGHGDDFVKLNVDVVKLELLKQEIYQIEMYT